jgi:hypothetical protein
MEGQRQTLGVGVTRVTWNQLMTEAEAVAVRLARHWSGG